MALIAQLCGFTKERVHAFQTDLKISLSFISTSFIKLWSERINTDKKQANSLIWCQMNIYIPVHVVCKFD